MELSNILRLPKPHMIRKDGVIKDEPSNYCNTNGIVLNNNTNLAFSDCITYIGDISFDLEFVQSIPKPENLNYDLQNLTGNIILGNCGGLKNITFGSLEQIHGTIDLTGLEPVPDSPVTLNFPQLDSLSGLTISNTGLLNTDNLVLGTALKPPAALNITTLTIMNNSKLTRVDLPVVTLGNVTISNNSLAPDIKFPVATTALSLSINFVSNFTAHELGSVKGDVSLEASNFFNIDLSSLNSVGTNFELSNAYSLNSDNPPALELGNLVTVGHIQPGNLTLQQNKFLFEISLPNLTTVHGYINIDGNISSISMPKLITVDESIEITTHPINISISNLPDLNCSAYANSLASQLPTTVQVACDSTIIHPTPTSTESASATTLTNSAGSPTATIGSTPAPTITSTPHHSSSSSLSTGAKAGIGVAAALIVLALLGLLFFRLRRRRSTPKNSMDRLNERDQSKQIDYSPMIGEGEGSSLGVAGAGTRYLDGEVRRGEGGTGDYEGERGRSLRLGGVGGEGGERAVSPVSMESGLRRSYGSRNVSPESLDRVPMGK